jgi:hypothetical protein
LLDEDFKFVSGYYSKSNNEYIFNDYFGNSLIVKDHIWDNKFHNQTIVDPITGDIHEINKLCLRHIDAKTYNQCTFPKNEIDFIKQASVFNNKLAFYCDSYIYYSQLISDSLFCYKNTAQFNVCKRFENGIYKLQGNNLLIYKLNY